VLVGQRTQTINAIRGRLSDFGFIAPQGPSHVERLITQIEDPASGVPEAARCCLVILVDALRRLQEQAKARWTRRFAARAKADDTADRLMSVPGIGPLIAAALEAMASKDHRRGPKLRTRAQSGTSPLAELTGQARVNGSGL
jgi:transposase